MCCAWLTKDWQCARYLSQYACVRNAIMMPQVFRRDAAVFWATTARKLAGCCAYNLGYGVLCVTMRRGQQLQHVVVSRLDAVCQGLRR
jgi:hypothetical protein